MRSTFRLGRIAGIEVGIHWSLLVIGVLLVGSLAGGQLPNLAPNAHGSYLAAAVLAVAFFFISILAHELAHSVVARRQGQKVEGITLWLLGGSRSCSPNFGTGNSLGASATKWRGRFAPVNSCSEIFFCNVMNACSNASGRGGQPGMWTSTGM